MMSWRPRWPAGAGWAASTTPSSRRRARSPCASAWAAWPSATRATCCTRYTDPPGSIGRAAHHVPHSAIEEVVAAAAGVVTGVDSAGHRGVIELLAIERFGAVGPHDHVVVIAGVAIASGADVLGAIEAAAGSLPALRHSPPLLHAPVQRHRRAGYLLHAAHAVDAELGVLGAHDAAA